MNKNPLKKWMIKNIKGLGQGIVATLQIKPGETVLEDEGFFIDMDNNDALLGTMKVIKSDQERSRLLDNLYYRESDYLCYKSDNGIRNHELALFKAQCNVNCFGNSSKSKHILYLKISKLNHSCKPNALMNKECVKEIVGMHNTSYFVAHHERDRLNAIKLQTRCKLIAINLIKEGDEILISYLHHQVLLPMDQRSACILKEYKFKCTCTRCVNWKQQPIEKYSKGAIFSSQIKETEKQVIICQMKERYDKCIKDRTIENCELFLKYERADEYPWIGSSVSRKAFLCSTHWRVINIRRILCTNLKKLLMHKQAELWDQKLHSELQNSSFNVLIKLIENYMKLMFAEKTLLDCFGCKFYFVSSIESTALNVSQALRILKNLRHPEMRNFMISSSRRIDSHFKTHFATAALITGLKKERLIGLE